MLLALCSCATDINKPGTSPHSITLDSITYQLTASGMQSMRAGEFMVLWVKVAPDTSWNIVSVLTLRYRYPDNSAVFVGKFYSKMSVESIKGALITLERT